MIRYGKPSAPLLAHKAAFFEDNTRLLEENHRFARVYADQPRRSKCKACDGVLGGERDFAKLGIDYFVCPRCGHLNGGHEDTDEFCRAVYTEDGGAGYAKAYAAKDEAAYRARVADIYLPKAQFLLEALGEAGMAAADLSCVDLGAGSGYFVAALLDCGVKRATGYEVSAAQIGLADAMLGEGRVLPTDFGAIEETVAGIEADVVSMVGVLEHLQHPRAVLAALTGNPSVSYLFLSVPLFSPSVVFELAFPGVMQRQLSGGHTHLFTESSLDWICREFGFERMAEWWFGTDLVDLYRSVAVTLGESDATRPAADIWRRMFLEPLDAMQLEMDRNRLSSEVHMLLRIAR